MNPPISLLICALGGEGGGVLSSWLMDTARRAGFPAQSSSIPGVAQRTGATTYYVEVWPTPLNALQGQRPVFSLNPVPGALDALLSSELLETARQVSLGLVSPDRTRVFSSSGRSLTTQERISMGDGRADSAALLHIDSTAGQRSAGLGFFCHGESAWHDGERGHAGRGGRQWFVAF
jgi:indolepyruvate ferredoxin oxidoreductase, beta subunit